MKTGGPAPDGASFFDEEDDQDKVKPWDKFFQTPPPEIDREKDVPEEWTLLHGGRSLEDGLIASSAELVSDLLWGNLALPIDKSLEKLQRIKALYQDNAEPDPEYIISMTTRIDSGKTKEITDRPSEIDAASGLTHDQRQEELLLRREVREHLELSMQQLEEMQEKKGEFGNEYRVITAAWYMMMLPKTNLRSPLICPDDASKAAWEFMEREYERRRVEGDKWRTAREDETIFDEEAARVHPYELQQTRRRYEMTMTIPVPARTKPCHVRIKIKKGHLRISVQGHPVQPAIVDGETFAELHVSDSGREWHIEGEFETRRVVLDIDKEKLARWPCLMKADAPPESELAKPRPKVSGAKGEVNVYEDEEGQTPLFQPQQSDKFFSWGAPPPADGDGGGARSVRGMLPGKLGGGGKPPTKEEAEAEQAAPRLEENGVEVA